MGHKESKGAEILLDPVFISRIRSLSFRARLVVEGFMAGLHRSPYHGFSAEFRDHRSYQPTDPPRLVDWRVFARSDKLYVKQFTDETNLRAYLLVDCSGSMGYRGDGPLTKHDYARSLAASLALLLLKQRDAVGLCLFDETARSWIRPSTASGQLERILGELVIHDPSGETRPTEAFTAMASRIPPRGLIIVLSDFLFPAETQMKALRHLASGKHELVVIRILDKSERSLSFSGLVTLKDLETKKTLTVRPALLREAYRNRVYGTWRALENDLSRFRAHLVDVDTTEPFSKALLALLAARRKMR